MACPKLQLIDEVFGPPLLPAAGIAKRGEWVDLVRQDGVEKSTDVTGVTVRVKESTAQRNIEVATTVGGVVKRRVLGWPGGSADELVASRFPIADFLVIRHVVGPSGGQNAWTFVVFDLSAAGAVSASNPTTLGPFYLPVGVVQLQFCPDPSGQLILLWSGYPASAMGRIAAVYRSDMDAPSAAYSLIDAKQSPSWNHFFGTTDQGMDVFSQVVLGSRTSLFLGAAAAALATTLAACLGILAAYSGGWVDDVINFATNVFLVIPTIPLLRCPRGNPVSSNWDAGCKRGRAPSGGAPKSTGRGALVIPT